MAGELENALEQTQRDAEVALRAAELAMKAAKRAVAAAKTGDLAALARALTETRGAAGDLAAKSQAAQEGWTFDARGHAESGALAAAVKVAAEALGLTVYEQDGSLFSYPSLVRIQAADPPAVEIDRARFRTIRPTYVAGLLAKLRNRPQRFKPEQFLELLYRAYEWERHRKPDAPRVFAGRGPVVLLVDLLELITLFPEVRRDYGKAEFTRDLYLLDRSRVTQTKDRFILDLSASTGSKQSPSKLLRLVAEDGSSRIYHGIAFR